MQFQELFEATMSILNLNYSNELNNAQQISLVQSEVRYKKQKSKQSQYNTYMSIYRWQHWLQLNMTIPV